MKRLWNHQTEAQKAFAKTLAGASIAILFTMISAIYLNAYIYFTVWTFGMVALVVSSYKSLGRKGGYK